MMTNRFLLATSLLWLGALVFSPLWSQAPSLEGPKDSIGRMSIFDAMAEDMDGILEVTMMADLSQLIRKRTSEEYMPARMRFVTSSGQNIDRPLEIKARGKTRKEICSHPPIKAKWKKKTLDSLGFSKFNEMKVVWQCKPGRLYEQTLLREYLVYRLYNLTTPYSYRVKLAKFTILDPRDTTKQTVKYGFFMEDDDQLALRLEGQLGQEPVKNLSRFYREELLKFFVFQYMISNTDWSFGNMHNIRVLQVGSGRTIPIAYDFDYAGVVAAIYAVPHESLPIKSVRERYYKGIECKASEIAELTAFYTSMKEPILKYCNEFEPLDRESRRDVVQYLQGFFSMVESRAGLGSVIKEIKP